MHRSARGLAGKGLLLFTCQAFLFSGTGFAYSVDHLRQPTARKMGLREVAADLREAADGGEKSYPDAAKVIAWVRTLDSGAKVEVTEPTGNWSTASAYAIVPILERYRDHPMRVDKEKRLITVLSKKEARDGGSRPPREAVERAVERLIEEGYDKGDLFISDVRIGQEVSNTGFDLEALARALEDKGFVRSDEDNGYIMKDVSAEDGGVRQVLANLRVGKIFRDLRRERIMSFQAIDRFKGIGPRAVPSLKAVLLDKEGDPRLKRIVAKSLGEIADLSAIAVLQAALRDEAVNAQEEMRPVVEVSLAKAAVHQLSRQFEEGDSFPDIFLEKIVTEQGIRKEDLVAAAKGVGLESSVDQRGRVWWLRKGDSARDGGDNTARDREIASAVGRLAWSAEQRAGGFFIHEYRINDEVNHTRIPRKLIVKKLEAQGFTRMTEPLGFGKGISSADDGGQRRVEWQRTPLAESFGRSGTGLGIILRSP